MTEKNRNEAETAEQQNTEEKVIVSAEETPEHETKTRTTEEVRQGHTGDNMRYVLGISFALLIGFWVVNLMNRDAPQTDIDETTVETR